MATGLDVELEYNEKQWRAVRKALGDASKDVDKAVRKTNKDWAEKLAVRIRAAAPHEGSNVRPGKRRRRGTKHKTANGALSGPAIVARGGLYTPSVVARASRFPHFYVQEFGGGVWWRRGAGGRVAGGKSNKGRISQSLLRKQYTAKVGGKAAGHIIGVRPRSPSMGSLGLTNSPAIRGGASGYFFWPTIRKNVPLMRSSWEQAAADAIRDEFRKTRAAA